MENSSNSPGCLAWLSILLTVLFVGLKLTGYITWSWLWVLSPIWINIALIILIIIIAGIVKSFFE
jgi:hypothetical protein